jgi:hypothetical protein
MNRNPSDHRDQPHENASHFTDHLHGGGRESESHHFSLYFHQPEPHFHMKLSTLSFGFVLIMSLAVTVIPSQAQRMPQDHWDFFGRWIPGSFKGIAVGANGNICTYNTNAAAYQLMNSSGNVQAQFGSGLGEPAGLAFDSTGNVYVLADDKISVFDVSGTLLRQWGSRGSADGQFTLSQNPGSYWGHDRVAIDGQDRVFVADSQNFRIQVFDKFGAFVRKWGSPGGAAGQFGEQGPVSIAIGKRGNVCVGDITVSSQVHRLQSFDVVGNSLALKQLRQGMYPIFMGMLPDDVLAVCSTDAFLDFRDSSFTQLIEMATNGFSKLYNYPGIKYFGNSMTGLDTDARGDVYLVSNWQEWPNPPGGMIYVLERTYNQDNPKVRRLMPHPFVVTSSQRAGTTLIDLDFQISDIDSGTVDSAALVFVNGNDTLNSILKLNTLVEGTAVNLGVNKPTNVQKRITWDAAADWTTNFGQVHIEILAKDDRGLLPFRWITLPVDGANPAVTISARPVTHEDMLSVWYWLIATSDAAVTLNNGTVKGVGGSFDGQSLASGTTTTAAGRSFLYQRLNVRAITTAERTRAQAGNYNFQSVSTDSVVKLP